jgi:hypothetical protein
MRLNQTIFNCTAVTWHPFPKETLGPTVGID